MIDDPTAPLPVRFVSAAVENFAQGLSLMGPVQAAMVCLALVCLAFVGVAVLAYDGRDR